MLSYVQVLTEMEPCTAVAFVDVPYSPAFLLSSTFDASITDDPDFRSGCECGFDAYFEEMFVAVEPGAELVFVEKFYTWAEIVQEIVENALAEQTSGYFLSRAWRAGFGLGWLSALAVVNSQDALRGLVMLTALLIPPEKGCQHNVAA